MGPAPTGNLSGEAHGGAERELGTPSNLDRDLVCEGRGVGGEEGEPSHELTPLLG